MSSVLLEARPYRPFKSSEEYLEAMREDLAEWLNTMYPDLMINADNFMDRLDTGVALCKHANNVRTAAEEYLARRQARNKSMTRSMTSGLAGPILAMGSVHYLPAAKSGTFFARDNVSNFITWCRKSLKIFECLLFETDDLIMRKNEKHVILCLLEVARRGAKFGMLAPMLVQMERQIDREIAADNKANGIGCGTQTDPNETNNISTATEMFDTDTEDEDDDGPMLFYGPQPQIITNDLKSLDEMVRDLVEKCTCPSQFPMVRVSEGKYRIGDTKVLIFVRILRSHVMVRVGGGWDTLSHYLDKHDPCRCKAQHRTSVAARLIPRTNLQTNGIELHKAQVIFERSPPSARRVISAINHTGLSSNTHSPAHMNTLSPPVMPKNRSRSPTPQSKIVDNSVNHAEADNNASEKNLHAESYSPNLTRRSMSPNPRKLSEFRRKQKSLDSGTTNSSKLPGDVDRTPINHVQFDNTVQIGEPKQYNGAAKSGAPSTEISTKFENISDNGSEISDEGYRSLGVILPNSTNNIQKRESLKNQQSIEDVETSNQPSSDSQTSPSEDSSLTKVSDCVDGFVLNLPAIPITTTTTTNDGLQPHNPSSLKEVSNNFEKSGIFITDDEITVDIASATGLRKTGFSDKIYGDDNGTLKNNSSSKIPRSPIRTRRRSVDAASDNGADSTPRTGLPIFNRKQPVYRSVRKPAEKKESPGKDINTWSGRGTKKRSNLTNETFISPNNNFERNSKSRSSAAMYDSNGRRIKSSNSSVVTSPVKTSTSPLAQEVVKAATTAKNDTQILEKMQQLLTQYAGNLNNGSRADGSQKPSVFDDFTTAWVHSNGTLERSNSCSPPTKGYSKRSSAASSTESTPSKDWSVVTSPRRDRGSSRIPAPVRNNTELY